MNRTNIKAALADPKKRRKLLNGAAAFLKEMAKEPPHEHVFPTEGYRVTYSIDVTADSAMQAALDVEGVLRHGFYRPYLVVRNHKTGEVTMIDLEEEEVC